MKNRKKQIMIFSLLTIFLVFVAFGFYNGLKIRRYTVESDKISNPVRMAVVSDLHSCAYGEKEAELIAAIESEHPDVIFLTGDIFDSDKPDDNALALMESIGSKYPCYFVTGNHEYKSDREVYKERMQKVKEYGIKKLSGECDTVEINGEKINICGINDYDAYETVALSKKQQALSFLYQIVRATKEIDNGNFTLLLSHRPEYFEIYAEYGFDLVLSGHTHGGQIRIPGILNGVYAPDQGLWPKYAGGAYNIENTAMIVSRGLARWNIAVPRFYNPPELVIVDIC